MKTWTADAEFFDIKQTLECGQVFRFKKTDDGGYVIHSLDKRCFLRREGDKIILSSDDEDYFRKHSPVPIFENGVECRHMVRLRMELV